MFSNAPTKLAKCQFAPSVVPWIAVRPLLVWQLPIGQTLSEPMNMMKFGCGVPQFVCTFPEYWLPEIEAPARLFSDMRSVVLEPSLIEDSAVL